jgi:hypothetical protein
MLEHVLATNHGTAGIVAPAEGRELSYGEKAVGLGFNPGANPEVKRMASVAITELQTAQMWAVKAITWQS